MNIKLFELKIIHFRGIITLVMISVFTIVIVEVLNYVKYIVLLLYIIRVIKFYLFEKGILIKKKKSNVRSDTIGKTEKLQKQI